MGFDLVLIMFVVVVLGGMGSVVGAMISGFIIGVVEVFSSYWIGQENKQAIYFLVLSSRCWHTAFGSFRPQRRGGIGAY